MQIKIKLNQSKFRALEIALRKAPAETRRAIEEGLKKALIDTSREVQLKVGGGDILGRRSGQLTGAIKYYPDQSDRLTGYVGVGDDTTVSSYAWLLGRGEKTITPKQSQYLAIPVADGLTSAGVPRYAGPRDVPDGFFFKKQERLLFGRKTTGGSFELLFVFKKSVTVEASGILPDVAEQQKPKMARTIKTEIMNTIKKLGIR